MVHDDAKDKEFELELTLNSSWWKVLSSLKELREMRLSVWLKPH
jgi:hypothetical protein